MTAMAADVVVAEVSASSHESRMLWSRCGTTMVLVAVVYAAVSQGAFYSGQLRITVILVFAGLGMSMVGRHISWREIDGPVVAAIVLAAWYLVSGLGAHDVRGAVPAVALLGAMATTVLLVRRADAREQQVMLGGLLGVGMLVALTGWVGVAWRQQPRALEDGGLWRAASTISYANATGGILAALALLALGTFVVERKQRVFTLITYVVVVGLLATLSRAGLIGFVVGLSVLAVWTRGKVLARSLAILAGALVALAALAPSMPASHQAHPILALVGLGVGAAMSVASPRVLAIVAIGIAIMVTSASSMRHSALNAFGSLRENRFTTSSPDRGHELHAALQLAREHPVAGVGPGHVDLTWNVTSPAPLTMHVSYAHNEYLQTLDETGGVGLFLVASGLALVGVAVWRARRVDRAAAIAGCVSALVALGVHSSMDFLWHIPLIPLTGAALVGVLLPQPHSKPN